MWNHLKHRCVVYMSGVDVKTFLQGLITQDVFKLTPNGCLYSLMLTPQGRFLYDFFLCAWGDELYLIPQKATVEAFIRHLSFYTLGRPIVIQEKPEMVVASDLGHREKEAPSAPGLVMNDPRRFSMGRLYLGPVDVLPRLKDDSSAYVAHRIDQCVPEGPEDLISYKSIPLENRMDELNAIDWTKGCYVGQELTSRTKHIGEIRKNLFTIVAEESLPSGTQELLTDDKTLSPAGVLRSRFVNKGLAQIRLEFITRPTTRFRLSCGRVITVPSQPNNLSES